MSVTQCLEVEETGNGRFRLADRRWRSWQDREPGLFIVEERAALRGWLRGRAPSETDPVLAALARLAGDAPVKRAGVPETEARAAAAVLAWVLAPGARRVAQRLDSPDIERVDELVGAQLWIEVRTSAHLTHKVAANILLNTRAGVLEDLGLRAGRRAVPVPIDPAYWDLDPGRPADGGPDIDGALDVAVDSGGAGPVAGSVADFEVGSVVGSGHVAEDLRELGGGGTEAAELLDVLGWARRERVISGADAALLIGLVGALNEGDADARPRRRSCGGMLANAATAQVAAQWGIGPSTIRRRASRSIAALAAASDRYIAA